MEFWNEVPVYSTAAVDPGTIILGNDIAGAPSVTAFVHPMMMYRMKHPADSDGQLDFSMKWLVRQAERKLQMLIDELDPPTSKMPSVKNRVYVGKPPSSPAAPTLADFREMVDITSAFDPGSFQFLP